ncbi:MAG: hypothetical protein KDA20_10140 [Phycisphaerales bacterium]|nr:hypothetical protein [Phycisphaerales bacterium]
MARRIRQAGKVEVKSLEVHADGRICADVRCVTCGYDLIHVPIEGVCPECGTEAYRSTGVMIAARDGLVVGDATCGSCGYDLRGLPAHGACPECASPIRPSILGSRLEAAAPEYVTKLARGAMLVSIASVLAFVFVGAQLLHGVLELFGLVSLGAAGSDVLAGVAATGSLVALGVYLVGWWLLTVKDPVRGKAMVADRARRSCRFGLVLMVLVFPLLIISMLASSGGRFAPGSMVFGFGALFGSVLTFIGTILQYVRSMTYVGLMSTRFSRPRVRAYADSMAWIGPLTVIFTSLIAAIMANSAGGSLVVATVIGNLGPAAMLVMYWHLMEQVRRALREVRAAQEARPAQPPGVQ